MSRKINTAYTNTSAFNVTSTSDLNIMGDAAIGNGLYFAPSANTIHNVTVSSSGTAKLGNALNVTAGSSFGTVVVDGTFNSAGFLTLKSDANGTARVGQSIGNITNNVTVERYIPPRRAWRFMSVPVVNDTLHIRTAWQEGVNNPSLWVRYDPHPGYGTHITGDNNTSLGYDYNTTYNASIKTWVQSTSSWSTTAPPTVSTLINAYDGYCLFVRGSRAVDLSQATNAIPDPTVLRVTGKINNNGWSKTYSGLITNNVLLVGNPYASSVDISSMLTTSTGIYSNKFWVWDPGLAGIYGVGGYITYSNGIMAPLTTNYPVATTIIQGNQALLVQSNATSATIKFKQVDKTASESNIFAKHLVKNIPAIYVNLVVPSGNDFVVEDGVATGFDNQFSSDIDGDDANKIWNFNENLALVRNTKTLAIELRPAPVVTDTLFLRMYIRQQPYALKFFTKDFESQHLRAWVVDKYLGTKTEVNLADTTVYSFAPNPDTNSYRNRFMLVFNKQLITNPIPVTKLIDQSNPNTTGNAASIANRPDMEIYPNPAKPGNKVIIELKNINKENYQAEIYDINGQKLVSSKIIYDNTANNYNILLPANISAGIYNLRLINDNGNILITKKLIVGK